MISRNSDAVLVLVEDAFIRRYIRAVLAGCGRSMVEAESAHAIELVRSKERKVALLITNRPQDFELFAGELPILYLSAQPDETVAARFRECRMLRKPFTPAELSAALTAMIGPNVS